MGYFGSKATSGLCQALIALMPPHSVYIESHLGGGALMKRKPTGVRSIGIDRDAQALEAFACDYPVELVHGCAHAFLASFPFLGPELVYSDPVPSIYSIVPPNDGSALRHGHHFEPVDFVIDHGRGHHDAYSTGSCQRTYARACGCRQRPRRHREELIESERGWSGREAFVTMMQTADLGQGNDRSGPGRLNGSSIRCVLADRQVGP